MLLINIMQRNPAILQISILNVMTFNKKKNINVVIVIAKL